MPQFDEYIAVGNFSPGPMKIEEPKLPMNSLEDDKPKNKIKKFIADKLYS